MAWLFALYRLSESPSRLLKSLVSFWTRLPRDLILLSTVSSQDDFLLSYYSSSIVSSLPVWVFSAKSLRISRVRRMPVTSLLGLRIDLEEAEIKVV